MGDEEGQCAKQKYEHPPACIKQEREAINSLDDRISELKSIIGGITDGS